METYHKIGQLRQAIKEARYHNLKSVTFNGTVKLHGTNSGVSKVDGELVAQSRTRVITVDDDNYGFAAFVEANKDVIAPLVAEGETIFGEWCGEGIQKGVAISQLPKRWVLFDGTDSVPDRRIYNVNDFKTFTITIDMERPDLAQAEIIKMVEEVEACCPVAKALGVEGTGEGIVFMSPDFYDMSRLRFKAKGAKHSATKVKTLAPVDVEKMNSVQEFVEYAVTENRLRQGVENTGDDMSKMGDFLRWICNDIHSEEADTLEAAGLTAKDVNKHMMDRARTWFQELN